MTNTPHSSPQPGKCITVGLLWHSANSPNLGIGALTVSNIAIIEKLAEKLNINVQFKVFQWRDPDPVYVTGENIEIVSLRARHMLFHPAFLKPVRTCDLILDIGAGDSFADIYGLKRFTYNALSKLGVLLARRPLILPPQTIGPFQRTVSRITARFLMNRARAVVTRDALSTGFANEIGLTTEIIEATDVAMVLPFDQPERGGGGRTRVGINVSGLLLNGGYSQDNMFGLKTDYPVMIKSLIRRLLEREEVEVHLVPHVIPQNMPVEDDYQASRDLAEEFPELIVAPRFDSPSAAKHYIAGMDFFCGARMHACIAAFSSGVPVIPHAYSRKFSGLFGTLGYTWLADLKTMDADEVVDETISAFDQRQTLASDVKTAMAKAEAKLGTYEDMLERTMRTVVEASLDG